MVHVLYQAADALAQLAQAADTVAVPATMAIAAASASATPTGGHKMKMPCHGGMNHGGMNHGGMNHGDMNHGGMDHGSSGGMDHSMPAMDHDMPGMDPGMKMCKMSMTLNADYENLCILTDKVMVTDKFQLILAMIGIALFTLGYEYFKYFVGMLESRYSQFLQSNTVTEKERSKYKMRLSTAYALSVGYSFIIMLLFMTFNVWVMLAVCIGAGIGHYLVGGPSAASLVCH